MCLLNVLKKKKKIKESETKERKRKPNTTRKQTKKKHSDIGGPHYWRWRFQIFMAVRTRPGRLLHEYLYATNTVAIAAARLTNKKKGTPRRRDEINQLRDRQNAAKRIRVCLPSNRTNAKSQKGSNVSKKKKLIVKIESNLTDAKSNGKVTRRYSEIEPVSMKWNLIKIGESMNIIFSKIF